MSWLFSQALVGAFSGANCSDGAQSAPSSGNPIPQAYCASDKMTAFSRLSRYGMTFAPLTEDHGEELLTWFRAGFPARTSVQPDEAKASPERKAASGLKCLGLLARFDLDTRSWRTHQCLLFEDSTECLETFPRWGMMRGGELWELSMSAHLTRETVSGLLPTPDANCGARGGTTKRGNRPSGATRQVSINDVVKMWPTPCARDWEGANAQQGLTWKDGKSRMDQLPNAVKFATPQARDFRTGSTDRWDNPERSRNLNDQIGGQLNPTWVEWLMVWPLGWTDLKPSGTDRFRQWQHSHGGF